MMTSPLPVEVNKSDEKNAVLGKASKKKRYELGTLSQHGGRGSDTPN